MTTPPTLVPEAVTISLDGQKIAFVANSEGRSWLFLRSLDSSVARPLTEADASAIPFWSPDGRVLVYRSLDPKTGFDLWTLPMDDDKKPNPLIRTDANESGAQFSPDGKWIVYQSNESGQYEIYVQPFPGLEGKFQVSTNGGAQPRWGKDGKELFYIGLDGRLMAAPIRFSPMVFPFRSQPRFRCS